MGDILVSAVVQLYVHIFTWCTCHEGVVFGVVIYRKGFMGDKYDNSSAGLNMVARPRKGERLHKQNMQCGDGSKYMCYIKFDETKEHPLVGMASLLVSKEQHQLVRSSMKNSSNSIQSRSLNHAAVGKQRSSSSICKLENLADKEMANGSIFGPRN
ncbi:hypothetical protein CsSME_00004846 [Camellia sinensis var. sinensis]